MQLGEQAYIFYSFLKGELQGDKVNSSYLKTYMPRFSSAGKTPQPIWMHPSIL